MPDTAIVVNSETHSLTVQNETYSMTKVPSADSQLVQAAMQNVLHDLSLATVLTDLDRAADLIYLAYNGVAGTGALAASVSSRQKALADLCADCVVTMTTFRQGTQDILGDLIDAFENLLEAEEEIALEILADCGEYAKSMSTKCESLAAGFEQLKVDTQKDAETTEVAVGTQVEKLKELKKLRDSMSATLKEQQENAKELRARVAELNDDIAEAKQQEETESKRAFIGGMVSAFSSAIGSGLGAYVASQNPISTAVSGGVKAQAAKEESEEDKAAKKAAETQKATAEEAERKKQAAVKVADENLATAQKATVAAKAELDAKKVAVDKAREAKDAAAITKADQEVEDATKAYDAAQAKEAAAQKAKKAADSELKDAKAATAGAAAALSDLSAKLAKMSEAAQKRADSIRTYRLSLLSEKREQERLKRESLTQIAGLTERLSNSDDDKAVEESSQYALEMAVWAFANVYAALSNAKFFWDSMATYCDRLSKPQTVKLITRQMKKTSRDKEDRIAYYSSERFMQTAIFYLVRWKALSVICDDYVTASEDARTKVVNNIKKQPTIAEARAQLADLKSSLTAKLEAEKLSSDTRTKELDAQQKLLQETK